MDMEKKETKRKIKRRKFLVPIFFFLHIVYRTPVDQAQVQQKNYCLGQEKLPFPLLISFWLKMQQRKIKRRKRNVFYFPFLVVRGTALGELKDNRPAGQSAVNLAVGIESVVNTTTLLLVQDNLDGLAAVLLGADALADNLDGVDEVGEDGVVNGRQSTRTGTLLGLVAAGVDGALGAGEDTALSDEEDVTVRELLLELAGEAVLQVSSSVLFSVSCILGKCNLVY